MKNEYFILRHGHSKANEAKIILSQLEDGKLEEFTLTEKGEDQDRNSASKAKTDGSSSVRLFRVVKERPRSLAKYWAFASR